ncbi:MAG: MBL fold metallo-hydrolase [Candidatus Eisenbacteria bacterium]|uniref:MBL fold metallo-hydrolase n=1 Tax=Eiseniibacteriota bacterium TaxID=2212470 RepID=A0A7Y2H1M1_UNCEI|nr:MBL fold metallo-hydrolase [Candidatus Eisenbacteria bacterium]
MKLEFHGAARGVTGSRHLLRVDGKKILLDCGLFQGRRQESIKLNRQFGFDPADLDAVVLSHAHIDHSGALPALVRNGFRGAIHATFATADLLTYMLRDSAMIQEKDIEYLNKRRRRKKQEPLKPIYTMEDAQETLTLLEGHRYHRPIQVLPGVDVTFYDAGHILGSAVVQLELTEGNEKKTLVFSGDLGRKNIPILRDPEAPPKADAVIVESTYGNREHDPIEQVDTKLASLINRVFKRQGKIVIPAFAVGRTQEIVYSISRLIRSGDIPGCCVYVDSPLAVNVTDVFARHPETYDKEIRRIFRETGDPFGFDLVEYVRSVEDSKALNTKPGPFIVLSASGMVEAGRILHHTKNSIEDSRNCMLFVGYQAAHTLGRRILEGADEIKIFGDKYNVRAEVTKMNEFSAHADKNELMSWIRDIKEGPSRVFVVHGEESQSLPFAERLEKEPGISDVIVPALHQNEPL